MAGRPAPRHSQLDGRALGGRGPAATGWSTGRGRGDRALRVGRTDRSIFPRAAVVGTTGDIEALSLWAGQSVALARQRQPAADIVAELVSRL